MMANGLPCYGCAYRKEIPGDAHSRCAFDWMKHDVEGLATICAQASPHGIRRGWFAFPFNYDPVWGPTACPQHAETVDVGKVAAPNPMADLLSILGGRL